MDRLTAGRGDRTGWPLGLYLRIHLLHDFEMASKMATSCHAARDQSIDFHYVHLTVVVCSPNTNIP